MLTTETKDQSIGEWSSLRRASLLRPGNPSEAKRCYAWSHSTEGEKRRVVAVLDQGPVNSPEKAVRAAIVQEERDRDGGSLQF